MTPRGVCRIIMVAIILIGSGIGPMFYVTNVRAVAPAPTTPQQSALPDSNLYGVAAQVGGVISCTSDASTGAGLSGRVTDGSGSGGGLRNVIVTLVSQDAQGNEAPVPVPGNPTLSTSSGNASQLGFWDFNFDNVPAISLTNITLKFEKIGYLTEYFDRRYDITTSLKISITQSGVPGSVCNIKDGQNRFWFNGNGQTAMNAQGGIAGRVTVAIPPNSLSQNGIPEPIVDESIPITGGGGNGATILVYTATLPPPVSTPYSSTTDAGGGTDGYYRVGNIPPGTYFVKFVAPGYIPSTGTWWRDGGFNFLPYSPFSQNLGDIYYTRTVTIPTPSSSAPNNYVTVVTPTAGTDDGSYVIDDGVNPVHLAQGINGHLAQPATINGQVRDGAANPVPGATVELYNAAKVRLSAQVANGTGNYSFTSLTPSTTYFLKATPPLGVPLVSRWYPSDPQATAASVVVTPSSTGGVVSTTANITLVAGARFSGTIVDFDNPGTTLPGIKVQVFRATDDPLTAAPIDESADSDAGGNYTTNAVLEPGVTYKLAFVPNTGIDQLHASNFCGDPLSGSNCNSNASFNLANAHVFTAPGSGQTTQANIRLVAGSRIAGAITSPIGWTTAGLQVQVYVFGSNGQVYQTFQVAPSSGDPTVINYSTAALPTDTYKLKFVPLQSSSNTGFIPVYYSASASTGTTDVVQATGIGVSGTGQIFPGGGANVTLREGGQINLHVQVIDKANPGQSFELANTLVEIYGGVNPTDAPGTKLSSGTTDQNGNITFRALDTTAPNAGNPFAIQILPNVATKLGPTWVTFTIDAIKDTFNLTSASANSGIRQPLWLTQTLYKGSSIGGHIYDPNNPGYDFGSTVISLYDNNKKLIRSYSNQTLPGTVTKTVSGDAYYKILVQPGTYYLGFTPPITNPNPYNPFFYPNSTDLINDQSPVLKSIEVGVSDNFTTTDAVFTPKGRIKFVVVNSTNQVQSSASVVVYNSSKQVIPSLNGTTDANGVYTTSIINAGSSVVYYASASKGGAFGYYNGHGGPFDPSLADPIIIPVGPSGAITPVITITLLTGLIATGTVNVHPSSGANRPLAGVQVSAIRSSDNALIDGPVATDSNGQYSLIAIPLNSSYYLKFVWQDPTGNMQTTAYHDGTLYGTRNAAGATVFNNVNVAGKDITFNLSGSLNGTIYQKNAGITSPMPTATISIVSPTNAASVYATATSKSDGTYLIPNLPPGTYKIQFVSSSGTGSITAYYYLNQAGGTFQFSQGTTIGLNDLSPQRIDQTFDLGNIPSIANCLIGGAMPVSATLNGVAVNFNGNCSGTGKIYVNTSPNVPTTTAAFSFADSLNTFNHTIVATSGSFPPDTNLYVKVAIISGTQEYSNYPEIIVRTAAAGDKWYFPYGDSRTTGSSVNSEFLHIFNYNTSASASVVVTYIISGTAPVVRNLNVPAGSRTDIEVSKPADPNGLNGAAGLTNGVVHATMVSANIPIMVERSIYNYSTGVSVTGGTTWGGSAMPGSTSLSADWSFADGTSSNLALGNPNYNTFFTIFNPNSTAVCVLATLYSDNSTSSFSFSPINVPAGQFVPVNMASILSGVSAGQQANFTTGFATRFTGAPNCNGSASPPFVVEQTSQYAATQTDGTLRKGEVNLLGALSSGLQWYFMEGLNDKVVSRTYHLLNTTAQVATVTFTVQLDNPAASPANPLSGSNGACGTATGTNPVVVVCTIQPSRRLSVQVNDVNVPLVGRTFGFSVNVVSNQPIVLERGVKFTWRQIPLIDGLFGQMAINRVANTWLFAAGSTTNDVSTGKLADMALNVYNSNNAAVRLKITYYTATSGASTNASSSFYLPLDALSRTTIRPGARTSPDYPSVGPNQTLVAVKIESVDITDALSLPVLAERVMFWNWPAGGNIGSINMGNASFGYIPPGS